MGIRRSRSNSFLEKSIYQKLDNYPISGKMKISKNNFRILKYSEYGDLLATNYNVRQLKAHARAYGLKVSGNKVQLRYRIFNFLKFSAYAVHIQRYWRGFLQRSWNEARNWKGRGEDCVNKTDFLSLERLIDIPYHQFISFDDGKGFMYGFDLNSLHRLVKRRPILRNPYTRAALPVGLKERVTVAIRLGRVLGHPVEVSKAQNLSGLSRKKREELRVLALFQEMDTHGHITDPRWLLALNVSDLIKFMKELSDIWTYRAQLTPAVKAQICPPPGFAFSGVRVGDLRSTMQLSYLRALALKVIDDLVTKGVDRSFRSLGVFYVLGALTLASPDAAAALPWLYQSVVHQ